MSLVEEREIHGKNQQFFQELIKKRPPLIGTRWPAPTGLFGNDFENTKDQSGFFNDFEGRLEVGKKVAQGGQAEIYEALFDGKKGGLWC